MIGVGGGVGTGVGVGLGVGVGVALSSPLMKERYQLSLRIS